MVQIVNDEEFYAQVNSEEDTIAFAHRHGLIANRKLCCDRPMSIRLVLGTKNKGYYFRCRLKKLRKKISLKKGSFFGGRHLTLKQSLILVYKFISKEFTIESLKKHKNHY